MPGATPQSITATTPISFAKSSSPKGSSGKNEISTQFFPALIMVSKV